MTLITIKLVLADGAAMWLRRPFSYTAGDNCAVNDGGYKNVCGVIWLDVNGKNPPNIIGKDTFVFEILKNSIMPSRLDDCKIDNNGWGCSSYILQNGDMKYIYK